MRRAALFACMLALASPAAAQTVEELQAQLAAQKRINELLKQRIRTLEKQASSGKSDKVAAHLPTVNAMQAPEDDTEDNRALERALVRRGRAVLPPNKVEVAPGFSWSHSGNAGASSDSYYATMDARIGLAGGWMIGGRVPFVHRSTDALGDNTGIGDPSLAVWKELMVQDGTWPSLVASMQYAAPLGDNFSQAPVALGSGYHRISARLTAVKSLDPVVFYGSASYTHGFERNFSGVELDPGGIFGLGAGATLAVSPDVSLSAGLNFSFADHTKANGINLAGSDTTVGVVSLGAGIILTKDVFLNLSSAFGITDDSPDVAVAMSVPFRF